MEQCAKTTMELGWQLHGRQTNGQGLSLSCGVDCICCTVCIRSCRLFLCQHLDEVSHALLLFALRAATVEPAQVTAATAAAEQRGATNRISSRRQYFN